jgi:hypothetical protein
MEGLGSDSRTGVYMEGLILMKVYMKQLGLYARTGVYMKGLGLYERTGCMKGLGFD